MPAIDVLHPPGPRDPIKPRAAWARPALAALALGAPMALGGAPYWSVPLFALVAIAGFVIAGRDRAVAHRDRLVGCWLILVGVLAFQLVPLPPALLGLIDATSAAASAGALDPLHVSRAATWRSLHHDPGSGVADLLYLLGLGAAYLTAMRVASREEGDGTLHLVAYGALLVAGTALAHQLTGQERVFGFYHPHAAGPPILSPLLNPNHLAALTGAGAILWLGFAVAAQRAIPRTASAIAAILCGVVCMLSLSRGGAAATVGCILLFVGINARRGSSDRSPPRTGPQVWLGVVLGAAIILAGLYLASTSLGDEYARGDMSKLDGIRRALGLLRGHVIFGVGSGAVPVAVASSGRLDPELTFLRVECLPIDLVVAFGIPAAVAALWLAAVALRDWRPPVSASPVVVGAWCAMLSLILHDMVDFSLFLGGVGYPAALIAGYLMAQRLRRWRTALPRGASVRRAPALALLAAAVLLVPFAWRSTLEADRDHVEEVLRADTTAIRGEVVRRALVRHPFDAYLPLLSAAHAASAGDDVALRFVARAMLLSPTWAQPHLLLARVFAARGLRSQSLVELREALLRSETVLRPAAALAIRLRPLPDPDELDHLAPRSPYGIDFLNATAIASSQSSAPESNSVAFVTSIDELMLRRDPACVPALQRRARYTAAHPSEAITYCDRIIAAQPTNADGYLCRGSAQSAGGDLNAAMRTYATGIARATDRYGLQLARARVYAARRDAPKMREAITAGEEAAGADLDRLIALHGLHGNLEAMLGNDPGAIEAFRMANSLAAPEAPFLLQLLEVQARAGDRSGVEQGCAMLSERGPLDARATAVCSRGSSPSLLGDAGR